MAYDSGFGRTFTITPSDTVNIVDAHGSPAEGILVTTAGNLVLVPAQGSATVTFASVPCGTFLPIKTKRINATGTTATICGLFGR